MPTAPLAQRRPHTITAHGHARADDYYWLRERQSPEVIAYLEAENRFTEESLAHTSALQERLFAELVAHTREADESAPVRLGAYEYSTRSEPGRQYRAHLRRRAPGEPEELLLDENALAEGHPFFALGTLRVSPDERLLAYTVALDGGEVYDLYVRDIASGATVDGPVSGVGEVEWAADSRTLFYTTFTESWRSFRAFRRALGQQAPDALVYEERDAGLYLHIRRGRSGAFLLLESNSGQTASALALPLDRPEDPPRPVTPRRHGVIYWAQHRGGSFYILTNDAGPGYRLVEAPADDPAPERWRELVPERPDVALDGFDVFAGALALYERADGTVRLRVVDLATGAEHSPAFDEPVYSLAWWESSAPWPLNPRMDAGAVRLIYSSLVTPPRVVEYGLAERALRTVKQEDVPGYDPSPYAVERLWATAPDGARVPISLVRRREPSAGPQPCLLVGYGSYGAVSEPSFNARWLPLVERGFSCAIAHIRGGGDLGEQWYRQGRALTKRSSFVDFIACAEHLVALGITSPELLAVRGRSAGGLLIGAAVTMRPDLFRAALALVPFVDVVTTSLDPSIPLVEQEYEEWGDPRVREQYEYMLTYSPYDNTRPAAYPAILATAGLHDPRVQYWEPAKWVAKMRALREEAPGLAGPRPPLLRTEMSGGHFGPSGRYNHLREAAFEWAFVLDALGLAL